MSSAFYMELVLFLYKHVNGSPPTVSTHRVKYFSVILFPSQSFKNCFTKMTITSLMSPCTFKSTVWNNLLFLHCYRDLRTSTVVTGVILHMIYLKIYGKICVPLWAFAFIISYILYLFAYLKSNKQCWSMTNFKQEKIISHPLIFCGNEGL